jgi:hypothetical protein
MASPFRPSALLVALLFAPASLAGIRYVNGPLATGANDGSSWANAYRGSSAVQTALTAAVPGDQIWVAGGTYFPTNGVLRTATFQLKNGVEIYGGFGATEVALADRVLGNFISVLSGDLGGNDGALIYTDNSYHIVNAGGTGATAVLDGFNVASGNANGAGANEDRGGGILCVSGASPTIRNCNFRLNRCSFGGGAGYINGSAPTFTDCTFQNNDGANYGGAFDMATSVTATFDRCVFSNNQAARAGAIEIFGSSTVKVYDSLFVQNTSNGAGGGGAIYISGSNPQIRNCTIVANTATANGTGGILGSSASPSIINCIVYGNVGQGGATGIAAQISPATLSVTHTLTSIPYSGTGNVTGTPVFDACGAYPYHLASGSPGIDAGSNAGVPGGISRDLGRGPRFVDVPATPDTGTGTAPIVDMGAFEADADCNGNGVPDECDIAATFSYDVNANGIPDECECQGGAPAVVYCTAKLNSQLCVPAIAASGYASVSNSAPFTISASSILNQKTGLLFYGYQANATSFQGGTLCVHAPIKRTATMNSGGSPTGTNCTGTFAFDFNALIQAGGDPLIAIVGQQVNAQYWSRDPQDPFTTNTTNAVQFAVCQ